MLASCKGNWKRGCLLRTMTTSTVPMENNGNPRNDKNRQLVGRQKRNLRGVTERLVQPFRNKDLFINLENKRESSSGSTGL